MMFKPSKILLWTFEGNWGKPDFDAKVWFNMQGDMFLHVIENTSYSEGARLRTVYW